MADLLTQRWVDLVHGSLEYPRVAHGPCSRIINDFEAVFPFDEIINTSLTLGDLGYTKAKLTQLKRNYWPEDGVQALVDKLVSRRDKGHSSAASPLGNQEKGDGRSQGHCMQSIVVTVIDGEAHVDIYYRSTELIMKFMADLVFFSQMFVQLAPVGNFSYVRMRFSNTGLSTVMLPIFFRYDKDPAGFIEEAKLKDEWFYRICIGELKRFLNPNPDYTYRTRIKMIAYFNEHVETKKVRSLAKLLKGHHENLPEPDDCD